MADLLERLAEIKNKDKFKDIREQIDGLPKLDNTAIVEAVNKALMSVFAKQYEIEADRKRAIVEQITAKVESDLVKLVKNQNAQYDKVLASIGDSVSKIEQAIAGIPKADLSSLQESVGALDSSIKGIKPVDLTEITQKLASLTQVVNAVKNKKQKDVDLTPILQAISAPETKVVEFEVITDAYDFPVKVIAKEYEYED